MKQKLDSDAARLHRALSEHEHLAESDIAERALLPPKDARTKLYALFHLGFARHVELPRQADRPGGAIQLWKADCERSRVVVLADTRRALARLLKRRRFECDKDEGLDPFSLDDSRAADPRKRERLRGRLDRLDRAILQLDEACERSRMMMFKPRGCRIMTMGTLNGGRDLTTRVSVECIAASSQIENRASVNSMQILRHARPKRRERGSRTHSVRRDPFITKSSMRS